MSSWYSWLRNRHKTPSKRAFSRAPAAGRPLSARSVQAMKAALLAAGLAASIGLPAAAQTGKNCDPQGQLGKTIEGVAFTGDGDTIYVVGSRWPVRLWGLNAPELRDPAKMETVAGMRARALVADELAAAGHKVACEPIEFDGNCRVVATCRTGTGTDLTMAVLKAGLAYGFYLSKHPSRVDQATAYSDAEAGARKARAGLWPAWLGEAEKRP